jgi:hypothetical protein
MDPEIKDTYFRRFLVPIIISLLIFAAIVVVIATPPGTKVNWESFSTVLGGSSANINRNLF